MLKRPYTRPTLRCLTPEDVGEYESSQGLRASSVYLKTEEESPGGAQTPPGMAKPRSLEFSNADDSSERSP
jgi:hypothetical protein